MPICEEGAIVVPRVMIHRIGIRQERLQTIPPPSRWL